MGSVKVYGQDKTVQAAAILPQTKAENVKILNQFITKGKTDSDFLQNHSITKTFLRIVAVPAWIVAAPVAKVMDLTTSGDQFIKARDKMINLFAQKVLPQAAAKTRFNDGKLAQHQTIDALNTEKAAKNAEKEFAHIVGTKLAQIEDPKGFFKVADAAIESVRKSAAYEAMVDSDQKKALRADLKALLGKEIFAHIALTIAGGDEVKRADLGNIKDLIDAAVEKGYVEDQDAAIDMIAKALKGKLSKADAKKIEDNLRKKPVNHDNIKKAREKQKKEVRKHRSTTKQIAKLEKKNTKAVDKRKKAIDSINDRIDAIVTKFALDGFDEKLSRRKSSLEDVKDVVANLQDQITDAKIKDKKEKRAAKKLMRKLNHRVGTLDKIDTGSGFEKNKTRLADEKKKVVKFRDTVQTRNELKAELTRNAKKQAALVDYSRHTKTRITRDGEKELTIKEDKLSDETVRRLEKLSLAKMSVETIPSSEDESSGSEKSGSESSTESDTVSPKKSLRHLKNQISKLEKKQTEISKEYRGNMKLLMERQSIADDLKKIANITQEGEEGSEFPIFTLKEGKETRANAKKLQELGTKFVKVQQKLDAATDQDQLKADFKAAKKEIKDLKDEMEMLFAEKKKNKSDSSESNSDKSGSSTDKSGSSSDKSGSSTDKSGSSSSDKSGSSDESSSVSGSSSSSETEKAKKKKKTKAKGKAKGKAKATDKELKAEHKKLKAENKKLKAKIEKVDAKKAKAKKKSK